MKKFCLISGKNLMVLIAFTIFSIMGITTVAAQQSQFPVITPGTPFLL